MSSDSDSKRFLPTSLREWLQVLTSLVTLTAPIAAGLGICWKSTEGEVSVNTRLLAALALATPTGFVLLWLYSLRRYRRLKAFEDRTPKPLLLTSEELEILRFFAAHDGLKVRAGDVWAQSRLPEVRFYYHWHRLFTELGLLDHAGTHFGETVYMLSHSGRKYLVENGLVQ